MKWDLLNFIGLLINIIGAILITSGVIVRKKRAIVEGLGLGVFSDANKEQNIKLPSVQFILSQSRRAVWGLILLIVGFLLQAICALHPVIKHLRSLT
jgi:hypothetical protein